MSWLHALIIGMLQGLTEFFPVSSSAHLKLAKLFLGIEASEAGVFFDLACHLGTLLAVLLFLRKDIIEILFRQRQKMVFLFTAMLPLIPFYFLLKPLRDFASRTEFLGVALMLTSLILFVGNRLRIKQQTSAFKLSLLDSLCIGTMQSAALIPGISRSASTISCARVLGWNASEAARFSFLLSIPTILAGSCAEGLKLALSSEHSVLAISFSSCLIGFLSSWGVGLVVIRIAMRWLENGNLRPFAWYCLILGVTVTLYFNVL
jgi:undecaprenyl-diphosphatase